MSRGRDGSAGDPNPREARIGLGDNPLSSDELLQQTFYGPSPSEGSAPNQQQPPKPKPTHYKVISISLYQEDLERLKAMVAELKRRGYTKASRSQLIRFALDTVDLDALPRGY